MMSAAVDIMAQIYQRLSLKHVRSGWPVYWRIMLPVVTHLVFLGGAFAAVFLTEESWLGSYVERFAPSLADRPLIPNAAAAAILYALGFPLVRRLNVWLSRRFDCGFYRSQFAILASVGKFNGALFCLYLLFAFLVVAQWDYFRDSLFHFGLWIFFLTCIFLGVVGFSAALYGWLHEQFEGENLNP
jgi:hypothetical protein